MKQTPLYDLHKHYGAKFGAFAGYDMPLFYKAGLMKEHLHTRSQAGLFDICHMMHVEISGDESDKCVERLCPLDVGTMAQGDMRYSFLLNQSAGIIDDLIVTRLGDDSFLLVCNAGRAQEDWEHIQSQTSVFNANATTLKRGFIAIQGPLAQQVLEDAGIACSQLKFMQTAQINDLAISRAGYTGEDGFEIAMEESKVSDFASNLLEDERLLPIGLGARDSLRLEAGLSLYGQDLDEDTTPMEAGLIWAIPKQLRQNGHFIGAEALAQKVAEGRNRRRVGFVPEGKAPVRAEAPILDSKGQTVGKITSGGFSPTLQHPIAMGMVQVDAGKDELCAQVRSKTIKLQPAPLPFIPHQYKR